VSGLQAKLAWSGLEDFLAESAQEGGDDDQQSPAIRRVASLLGPALAAAVAAAFAAAPPLWFCIVCPAVLGLVAPLLINIGLNQLAGGGRAGQVAGRAVGSHADRMWHTIAPYSHFPSHFPKQTLTGCCQQEQSYATTSAWLYSAHQPTRCCSLLVVPAHVPI
jgi:hypothetical protein